MDIADAPSRKGSRLNPRRLIYYDLGLILPVLAISIAFYVTFPDNAAGDPGDALGMLAFFESLIVLTVAAVALTAIGVVEIVLRKRQSAK